MKYSSLIKNKTWCGKKSKKKKTNTPEGCNFQYFMVFVAFGTQFCYNLGVFRNRCLKSLEHFNFKWNPYKIHYVQTEANRSNTTYD